MTADQKKGGDLGIMGTEERYLQLIMEARRQTLEISDREGITPIEANIQYWAGVIKQVIDEPE
jgi:hypothetical protein